MNVRVRFPPSPTGALHIGSLRTALYNELFARKQGGTLILRIEDTDRTRFVEGATESVIRTLALMGIKPDEGPRLDLNGKIKDEGPHEPYIQSKRSDRHLEYAKKLIEMKKAYPCFCTPEELDRMRKEQEQARQAPRYNRTCRRLTPEQAAKLIRNGESYVIRLAVPETGSMTFQDEIRGEISYQWKEIDDQVIIKSDGMPTYHLAATCDDHEMVVTHVIRGEEWLSSTPKHVFIYQSFDWTVPKFAHLPLLLGKDKAKLSKRQGDVAVEDFIAKGYLPEALLNFVALMGWNPTADREIFTHQELINSFDLTKINKGGAIVNFDKLDWLNAHYIQEMNDERYLTVLTPYLEKIEGRMEDIERIALMHKDRLQKLSDITELVGPYLRETIDVDEDLLPWKTQTRDEARARLEDTRVLLTELKDEAWQDKRVIEERVKRHIEAHELANGDVLWPLRVALSGEKNSPSPFDLLYALGKTRAFERIDHAIQLLT